MRRAVLLLAVLSCPADAGPWRGDFNVGYFIATPKFSDQDKRVRTANDDAAFPEQHFQGLHLGVRAERDIAIDIALTGELDVMAHQGESNADRFVKPLLLPARSPNLNAFADRFVGPSSPSA